MPTTTSLLRQAESARNKQIEFEDQLAAYQWNISSKTQDDYLDYVDHLGKRLSTAGDPSKALSYQRTITSTRRSFVSHEIQRQAIDVLEGRQTSQGKYNTMVELHQGAVELGDLDLAQSLRLQLDNLDRTIQAEQVRADSAASAMASARATSIEDTIDHIRFNATMKDANGKELLDANGKPIPAAFNYIDANGQEKVLPTLGALKQIYVDGGDEGINQISQTLAQMTGEGPGNFWDIAGTVIEQIVQLNQDAATMVGVDTAAGRNYLNYARNIQDGTTTFDVAPGLTDLSYEQVTEAIKAARAGQQLFVPSLRDGKNVFVKSNVTDYVWGRDENGNYEIIPIRQEFGDNFSANGQKINFRKADGTVEKWNPADVKNKLLEQGFNINEADGKMVLGTTGAQQNQTLQALGILPGTSFDVVVGQDGNLRFLDANNRIIDLEVGEGGVNFKEVKQEDMSVFGDYRLNQFGKATSEGISLIKQITRQDERAKASDLLQKASSPLQNTTSAVLQGAYATSERLKAANDERMRAAQLIQPSALAPLQMAAAPGLNTTPVPANSRLQVKPVTLPTTNLRVTPTQLPTQNLQVTSSAPKGNLQVTNQAPQPKLTVSSSPNKSTLRVQ